MLGMHLSVAGINSLAHTKPERAQCAYASLCHSRDSDQQCVRGGRWSLPRSFLDRLGRASIRSTGITLKSCFFKT